jgi:ribosome-associated protein
MDHKRAKNNVNFILSSLNYSTILVRRTFLGLLKKKAQSTPEKLWLAAIEAAESKQAKDITVLDLREITSFADFFVIASGANTRQIQAIADEIEIQLKTQGEYPLSVEGYQNAEWVLLDYGDYLIHIFTEKARQYYDLERLWRDAKIVNKS